MDIRQGRNRHSVAGVVQATSWKTDESWFDSRREEETFLQKAQPDSRAETPTISGSGYGGFRSKVNVCL